MPTASRSPCSPALSPLTPQVYRSKFDKLLAQEEVLYADYFKEKAFFTEEKEKFEKIAKEKGDIAAELENKVKSLEEQVKVATELSSGSELLACRILF